MGTAQAGQMDTEQSLFRPSESFSEQAGICSMQQYQQMWDDAADDPEGFWGRLAKEELYWFQPFDKVLEWNEP
ncbi:MAG: acetyl-coenzyme A synthetase, partial [Planctomycetota bacterium]|nr:acetyl-coenzyme A synthetase [Planctomycetota bacterium]